ncbi:MAG: Ig-like domain-containing protein, partial [Lachnospiraceae bacterium]|nr:Ig-like domain-containing protein [Lachnospiraceae bacterium]
GALSKTEATTSAEGSVSGSIAIECGSEEDSVTVNKTIAKLPTSDTDKIAAAKAVVEKALAGIVATNETTKEDIQRVIDTALANAGISDVTVIVGALSKTEATTSAEGSISGSIAIECGRETDSVTVNKTIAKLLTSDTDKIAAAKAVVEKALAGIVATNETTKEDIQRVIDTALTNAGISDVTVTVGALSKTEATTSAEGSVSGNVTIECGSETGSVTVNKPIAKLPTSDADKPEVQEPPEKPGSTVPSAVSQKEQEKNALSLNAKLKVSQTDKKINIAWGKVSGADGYDVYVQYCGKKFTDKSITAVKSGKTTKVTVKKVNGKSLNLKKNYKIYVLAYKLVDNKKVTLGKTVTAHIVGRKNTKYTNVKAVKVKKRSYSLKKGETVKIQASTVLVNKSKKQLTDAHAKEFRYATSDKKVATVSKQGKIKAAGKGTCTIYVYARNGYAKQITVKVQ